MIQILFKLFVILKFSGLHNFPSAAATILLLPEPRHYLAIIVYVQLGDLLRSERVSITAIIIPQIIIFLC